MGHRCYELAIARLPDYLPILHHGFSAYDRANRHAFNFPAVVRRPSDFGISRVVADYFFFIHVDDYHVGVGSRLDDTFPRVHAEDASGIVRRNANEGIER